MRKDRLLVSAAVAAAVLGAAPAAAAQTYPPAPPPGEEVLGTTFQRPAPAPQRAERTSVLPFTGAELGAAGAAGAAVLLLGSVLVVAARRSRAEG